MYCGKPQTGSLTLRFGGEERIKNPFQNFCRDSLTVIFNHYSHTIFAAAGSEKGDPRI